VVRSDQRFVRLENARSRVSQEIIRIVVRGGNAQQIILRYAPSVCAVRSSLTPGSPRCRGQMLRTTWRWHEPCRSQKFALLFADRMLRNLGTSIHCFEQLSRASFLRSSLITTTASAQNLAHRDSMCVAARRAMGSVQNGGYLAQKATCLR
jgi:hypothetical protein